MPDSPDNSGDPATGAGTGPDADPTAAGSAPGESIPPGSEPSAAESSPDGRSLAPDEQYCPSCGEPIKTAAEICPECGVRQQPPPQPPSPQATGNDRVTAGVLALLLGGIGAHKFYLGETGMGILYLCFSWTLIPAVVGFVEGILYLTKSDAEFQRKYGN